MSESGAAGRAEAIKGWSEAVTALLKAVLYGVGILLLGVIIATALWRHWNSKVLVLETAPLADQTLRALGSDVNLRLAVGDAINERINSISQIVLPRGLNLAEDGNNEDFSLRPFHLDASTGDIAHILDFVLGRPSRPTIVLDVYCGSADCLKAPVTGVQLVVSLPGPDGFRLASFPLVGGEGALTRSLHQAIANAADTVLERYEPLPASVWFLNRRNAYGGFVDQYDPDWIRAVGAAAAGRKDKNAGCLPDLVVGLSLLRRGEIEAGRALEIRAAQGADLGCSIQGYTNIIVGLTFFALNPSDEFTGKSIMDHIEEANQKLSSLHIKQGQVDDLNYFRIPAANLNVKIAEILHRAKTGYVYLVDRAPMGLPKNGVAEELAPLLNQGLIAPPGKAPQMRHGALDLMIAALRTGVPRENVEGRMQLAKALMDLIHSDENKEIAPRALYMLEGELAVEVGVAANDALTDGRPVSRELRELVQAMDPDTSGAQANPEKQLRHLYDTSMKYAAIAFENALGTDGLPTLVEPFSTIDAITRLGDAHYAVNPREVATSNHAGSDYASAAQMFVQTNEPVEEMGQLAGAMAHWTVMRRDMGKCSGPSSTDELWLSAWASLGWPAPDICEFFKNGRPVAADPARPLAERMIRDELVTCYQVFQSKHPSKPESIPSLLDLQDCLNTWGVIAAAQKYSSLDVEQEIMKAVTARDAKLKVNLKSD